MKLPQIMLACFLSACAIACILLQLNQPASVTCQTAVLYNANAENKVHCKFVYDEMARKLVAYHPEEFPLTEEPNGFTNKLATRILKFTIGLQTETHYFLL